MYRIRKVVNNIQWFIINKLYRDRVVNIISDIVSRCGNGYNFDNVVVMYSDRTWGFSSVYESDDYEYNIEFSGSVYECYEQLKSYMSKEGYEYIGFGIGNRYYFMRGEELLSEYKNIYGNRIIFCNLYL